MIDKTKPKNKAHQKLETKKPGTIALVSIIKSALMTKVNKPKVKMVMGKVRIIKIGLRKVFIKPKTKAATKAENILVTVTPGNK